LPYIILFVFFTARQHKIMHSAVLAMIDSVLDVFFPFFAP